MIRFYTPADLEAIIILFTQTVHKIGGSYYSPVELEAWAPLLYDLDEWRLFFKERYTIVMDDNGEIVGFGCLSANGNTIDLLYTRHDRQSEGIGALILQELENEALKRGNNEIMLTTSATAWTFYQKRGYKYHHSEKKLYGKLEFDCQILCKQLPVFREIRRKDRIADVQSARRLLETGEYGFLAICALNDYGYGIPLNYAFDSEKIYFHCAMEGFKLDSIRHNNRVSFCVVGKTKLLPEKFSTNYESVLVFGKIASKLTEDERRKALDLLVAKYCPDFIDISESYIKKSFQRTNILRLDIEHIAGKRKT